MTDPILDVQVQLEDCLFKQNDEGHWRLSIEASFILISTVTSNENNNNSGNSNNTYTHQVHIGIIKP